MCRPPFSATLRRIVVLDEKLLGVRGEPGTAMMCTAVAGPALEGIDLRGARGVLVLSAASKHTIALRVTATGLSSSHEARDPAAAMVDALASNGMDEIEVPAFLRKQADGAR